VSDDDRVLAQVMRRLLDRTQATYVSVHVDDDEPGGHLILDGSTNLDAQEVAILERIYGTVQTREGERSA
jgi:hypothetical protein